MKSYDFIKTCKPLNRSAADCISSGDHFEYKGSNKGNMIISTTPLKTIKFRGAVGDLTGFRRGRVVVIGLYKRKTKRMRCSVWVVRCSCGNYTHKKRRTIERGKSELMCPECEYVKYLKERKYD